VNIVNTLNKKTKFPGTGRVIAICTFFFIGFILSIPVLNGSFFSPITFIISTPINPGTFPRTKQIHIIEIMVDNKIIGFNQFEHTGKWKYVNTSDAKWLQTEGSEPASISLSIPFNTQTITAHLSSGPEEGDLKVSLNKDEELVYLTNEKNKERLIVIPNKLFVLNQLLEIVGECAVIIFILVITNRCLRRLGKQTSMILRDVIYGSVSAIICWSMAVNFSLSPKSIDILNRSRNIQILIITFLFFGFGLVYHFSIEKILLPYLSQNSKRNNSFLILLVFTISVFFSLQNAFPTLRLDIKLISIGSLFFVLLILSILLIEFWKNFLNRIPIHVVVCFFIVMLIYWFFLTEGKLWDIFIPESFQFSNAYYDYLGKSILHGNLDVPADVIGSEAFVYGDKSYGYFGIAPAIIRIFLNWLFPNNFGMWTRLSLLTGCFFNLYFSNLFIEKQFVLWQVSESKYRNAFSVILLLVIGLGSTNIFLSRSSVYVEATMWGNLFSLIFFYNFIQYLTNKNERNLLFALIFAFLAFHTRQTSGLGAFSALGLLALVNTYSMIRNWRKKRGFADDQGINDESLNKENTMILYRQSIGLFIFILFAGGLQVVMNYLRFGTFLTSQPLNHYLPFINQPSMMPVQPFYSTPYIKYVLDVLFFPERITLVKEVPFRFETYPLKDYGFITPSINNPTTFAVAIPILAFLLFVLSLIGVFVILKYKPKLSVAVICPILGGIALFFAGGAEQRHAHDFFPFLVIAGATGGIWLLGKCQKSRTWQRLYISLISILGLLSIYLNIVRTIV
jgi:hypothetical protein